MDYQDMQTGETERMQPAGYQPVMPEATSKQPPNNMATASMVLGIVALVTFCCYYTVLPLGGLAILFGLLSRPEGKFAGQAKAGMIMGSIAMVLVVVFWGALIAMALSSIGDPGIQNMPVIPSIPDMTDGLENILTVFRQIPIGGGR